MAGEGGGGRTGDRMAKDYKILALTWWGWGRQYKMYKSIILINFLSRSTKLNPEN
jgi:hypothetical protein